MRKGLVFAAVVSSVLGVSGCAAALIGGAAAGGYYAGKDERTAGRITEDAAVTSAVKSKLFASRDVKALDVNVDTYEGVVSLRGTVHTAAQRAVAERLARTAKGVKSVRNELRVK